MKSGFSLRLAALLFAAMWIAGANCVRSTDPVDGLLVGEESSFNLGDTLTLGWLETAVNAPLKTSIRFDSVLEDSRCPAGVACVWEGNAAVSFLMEEPGGRHRFSLNTYSGYVRQTTLAGRTIGLIGVLPDPPQPGQRRYPEEYKAIVTIR